MDFSRTFAAADKVVSDTFAQRDSSSVPVLLTLHYNDGTTPDATVQVVVGNPAMEEDYVPGANPGPVMLILFISSDQSSTSLTRGMTGTFNGVDYDIANVQTDRIGGRKLKMRQRATPYNT